MQENDRGTAPLATEIRGFSEQPAYRGLGPVETRFSGWDVSGFTQTRGDDPTRGPSAPSPLEIWTVFTTPGLDPLPGLGTVQTNGVIWYDWDDVDTFKGTKGADQAFGFWNDDFISLRGGDDRGAGGQGNDFILGGGGNDTLHGGADDDLLYGGDDDDLIHGGTGDDEIRGDAGDDDIEGNEGNDLITGGVGDDTIYGGDGDDSLYGFDGDDEIVGGEGEDLIVGNDGRDLLLGWSDNDTLYGGDDNDRLFGDHGNDLLRGQDGNDRLWGGPGRDSLSGGQGNDSLEGGNGKDTLNGQTGVDTLFGGEGDDRLTGGGDNDFLYGGGGDDLLMGTHGNDALFGGTNGAEGDVLIGGQLADTFYFAIGDSGGTAGSIDVIQDFALGEADLLVFQGIGQATFQGEQSGFSNTPGAEAYYSHTNDGYWGDITQLVLRDDVGTGADIEVYLQGHIDLTVQDVFIV